jgi:transcriptional regulator with XRE-family HTH domain
MVRTPSARARPLPAKRYVRAKGTQRQAARHLNYSEHYFANVLNGRLPPGRKLRAALVEYLGLPESELFDGDGR